MPTVKHENPGIAALLTALAAAGEPLGEIEIVRQGDQIILPPNMEIPEAITWLQRQNAAENTKITFKEPIAGFPLDAARALGLAVKEMFGFKGVSDFWPQSIGLEIDADGHTDQVYVGDFELPNIEGQLSLAPTGPLELTVSATVKAKYQPKIKALVELARVKLREQSVYRGKAFKLTYEARTGNPKNPSFIRTGILGQLQVNRDIRELLERTVWALIEKTERCRRNNISLKRGILLEGPYGTGKTLFATETASITTLNGWTFVYLEDVRWLAQAYTFAQHYAPAVLFAEDIDIVLDGNGELPDQIRNTIDAVNTKSSDVIMVLTTNHADKLPKSLLRPGRLDAIIPFRAPDAETVEVLIRQYCGGLLAPMQDLTAVGKKLDGRIPAVIHEVVKRSKLNMIGRTDSDDWIIAEDLLLAADSMVHHLNLQEQEQPERDSVAELFGRGFGQGVRGHLEKRLAAAMMAEDDDDYVELSPVNVELATSK